MTREKIQILLDKDVLPEIRKVKLSEFKLSNPNCKLNNFLITKYGAEYRIVDLDGYYYQLMYNTENNLVKYTEARGPLSCYLKYLLEKSFLIYYEE